MKIAVSLHMQLSSIWTDCQAECVVLSLPPPHSHQTLAAQCVVWREKMLNAAGSPSECREARPPLDALNRRQLRAEAPCIPRRRLGWPAGYSHLSLMTSMLSLHAATCSAAGHVGRQWRLLPHCSASFVLQWSTIATSCSPRTRI